MNKINSIQPRPAQLHALGDGLPLQAAVSQLFIKQELNTIGRNSFKCINTLAGINLLRKWFRQRI